MEGRQYWFKVVTQDLRHIHCFTLHNEDEAAAKHPPPLRSQLHLDSSLVQWELQVGGA